MSKTQYVLLEYYRFSTLFNFQDFKHIKNLNNLKELKKILSKDISININLCVSQITISAKVKQISKTKLKELKSENTVIITIEELIDKKVLENIRDKLRSSGIYEFEFYYKIEQIKTEDKEKRKIKGKKGNNKKPFISLKTKTELKNMKQW